MNLYNIKKILNENGYYCVCLKIYNIKDVYCECLTLIKTSKNNHFVVIKKINENYVFFYDPLYVVIRKWKKERFIKRWVNICLIYTKV